MKNTNRTRSRVFHVGFHKTGTTFLQRKIFPLLQDGVCYVSSAGLEYGSCGWSLDASAGMSGAPSDALLYSSEAIAGGLFSCDMARLRALKAAAPDARIILSVREQRSLLRSTYWQAVKQGWGQNYRSFQNRIFASGKLDYAVQRQQIEAEFGPGNVLFILFEELVAEPQTVLGRIAAFAGCRSVPELGDTTPEKTSPSEMVVEAQRHLNRIGLTRDRGNGMLRRSAITATAMLSKRCNLVWEKATGRRIQLFQSDADRVEIEHRYTSSNRAFFARHYDTPFAGRYPGMGEN